MEYKSELYGRVFMTVNPRNTTPILLQAGYQKNKLAPKGFIILVD
ncbi:transposase [Ligilactobacillus equi DPC 6820]|uniref:Transposase n=1 Tax=Ligilactobacillus equi DPC 6820 TaxID=1392007 RepID=V7HV28_9LACO|nr:transposase [Ligilactobacillus equi DPC 6820]